MVVASVEEAMSWLGDASTMTAAVAALSADVRAQVVARLRRQGDDVLNGVASGCIQDTGKAV